MRQSKIPIDKMKAFLSRLIKIAALTILSLVSVSVTAQTSNRNKFKIIQLDTISVTSGQQDFNKFILNTIHSGSFNYRKVLKKAKSENELYKFKRFNLSKVELLKQFKKAARKSDSVEEFVSYFHERDFNFLEHLEDYVIAGLYNTMRKTTFNGLLDAWQSYY